MIVTLDPDHADWQLRAGRLGCPVTGCGRGDGPAPVRCGSTPAVWPGSGPRRARCRGCGGTQVLLPSWVLPRCGEAADVVGAALVAAAAGRRYRRIAAELDRPPSTIRRWLRRARRRAQWLRGRDVERTAALDPDLLADLQPQRSPLADAMQALAAAVHAAGAGSAQPACRSGR